MKSRILKPKNHAKHVFTVVVRREGNGYVSLCPELDVASQGKSIEDAVAMLKEAVELYLECAPKEEIQRQLQGDIFVTQLETAHA
ncbi:MAG: type II toxin-antitoxin system HicB family antitoxin [bacterium]